MIDKTIDVTALGELLVDMTENGKSPAGNPLLEANPGGAPCNVLAMVSKLGGSTAFIGKVGDDSFGRMLKAAIENCGIDSRGLAMDPRVHTTLAFVHNKTDGDREFSFYRKPGADVMLTKDEVDEELIRRSKIFHFGTLSSTDEPAREATRHALQVAKDAGCLISFDPNLREPLWDDLADAKTEMAYGMKRCHLLKISDNELQFFTGIEDLNEAMKALRQEYQIPLICLTLGTGGSRIWWGDVTAFAPAILQNNTIDTTGAGDCFWGCMLSCILKKLEAGETAMHVSGGVPCSMQEDTSAGLTERTSVIMPCDIPGSMQYDTSGNFTVRPTPDMKVLSNELTRMLRFANAGASILTTRKGALKMMPSKEEIMRLLDDNICE